MSLQRSLTGLFGLVLLATLAGGIRLWQGEFQLQNNLLALLPAGDETQITTLASERLSARLGNDFLFFVGGADTDQVAKVTAALADKITASHHFQTVSTEEQLNTRLEHIATLQQHRLFLLSDEQARQLDRGEAQALLHQAIESAYDLGNSLRLTSPATDPLGLFNHYILSAATDGPDFDLTDNVVLLESADTSWGIVHGRVATDAFNLQAQAAMLVLERDINTTVTRANLTLLRAGTIFHSARAAATARWEVTLIGVGSALGITTLFLLTFRAIGPLLLSLGSIGFGCLTAFVLSANLFGTLHLITLVFGASLIGVAVDYALHYLTRNHTPGLQHAPAGEEHSKRPLPGIGLALLTSTLGYGALMQADLPGLREMAVFSITGLLASGLFVLVIFPRLSKPAGKPPALFIQAAAMFPGRLWDRSRSWIALIFILLAAAGLSQLQLSSDLRIFHTPDQQLLLEQAEIEQLSPGPAANQFFLIKGDSAEALLQAAEHFKPELNRLVSAGSIGGYQLISDSLPSLQRQEQNRQLLLQGIYAPGKEADAFFNTLGFAPDTGQALRSELTNQLPMTPAQWLQTAPDEQLVMWLGSSQAHYHSIVLLQSVSDLAALEAAAATGDAVTFVDTVATISADLQARTQAAGQLLVLAYGTIGLLLLWRYRQLEALKLLLIPLGSSIATVALLSGLGIPLTLTHVFALYLVLGLGMDYGIFLRESGEQVQSCMLAIFLSVLTSSLSFGLLALSSTPMIAAFGLTVMLGGTLNWLLTPVTSRERRAGMVLSASGQTTDTQ